MKNGVRAIAAVAMAVLLIACGEQAPKQPEVKAEAEQSIAAPASEATPAEAAPAESAPAESAPAAEAPAPAAEAPAPAAEAPAPEGTPAQQ